jgi:hypothetical protein
MEGKLNLNGGTTSDNNDTPWLSITYILLNLMNDITMTATPKKKPTTAPKPIMISVIRTSVSEYSCHVWQLGTQNSDPSSRKKSSRHGNNSAATGITPASETVEKWV